MGQSQSSRVGRLSHRLAIALALATFPLIWVGGLVTTYDAGMAVPDWPGTYGYNLFLYPWQSWLAGPWDLFIEHGHRLLGALTGLLAIALVACTCIFDRRPWLIMACVGALILVVGQGVLGGARVLWDERLVAMVHACLGPLFFAYLAGLTALTSPSIQPSAVSSGPSASQRAYRLWLTAALAYLQLVFGAVLRHMPLTSSPGAFRTVLLLHLVFAGVLAIHLFFSVARQHMRAARLWAFGSPLQAELLLCMLVLLQIFLGAATFVAKYSWPAWLGEFQFAAAHVVQERSFAQGLIVTAHVANGSLILFFAVHSAMRLSCKAWTERINPQRGHSSCSGVLRLEAVQ
jgi:heme a synthase